MGIGVEVGSHPGTACAIRLEPSALPQLWVQTGLVSKLPRPLELSRAQPATLASSTSLREQFLLSPVSGLLHAAGCILHATSSLLRLVCCWLLAAIPMM